MDRLKLLIVANNQKWKTWESKIQALKDWFKPVVDLEIDLIHTKFRRIPFTNITNGKEIDRSWYDKNIHSLAGGYDMVLFSVPLKQWKGGNIRGRWTADKVQEMQLGADENGDYSYNDIKHDGGRWFNIARHEICHALYKIFKLKDNTHYWWELGKLDEVLKELNGKNTKTLNHVDFAISLIGIKEFEGKENNPVILNWAKELKIPYTEDETSWCSLFVNYVAFKCKLPRTNKLNARSWLDVGTKVNTPKVGDVCVFWREHKDSWKGHVGFYLEENNDKINVLGGNQNNAVSAKKYPKNQLLGYRRLI